MESNKAKWTWNEYPKIAPPAMSYEERRERDDREHKEASERYREDFQRWCARIERAGGPALEVFATSNTFTYYVVNRRTGAIITGNGKTGRTLGVLNKMLTFLEGALEGQS